MMGVAPYIRHAYEEAWLIWANKLESHRLLGAGRAMKLKTTWTPDHKVPPTHFGPTTGTGT